MPIISTDSKGNVTREHQGCVVEVRTFTASRNHSDTLDCSDFRQTEVTGALVYMGRKAGQMHRKAEMPSWKGWPEAYYREGEELAPIDRFWEVEITNIFVWRGSDKREAVVDQLRHPDCVIDYVEFVAAREDKARRDAEAARQARARELKDAEEKERNRPVKGKRMVVASGRKVKPGTEGTVAYVHDSGRVLLKADHEWQDRKANGTWVDGKHLKAR